MPGAYDMVWNVVVLTFVSLNLFLLYSLYLKNSNKNKFDSAKVFFLGFSIIIMAAFCLFMKAKNDAIWRALIELLRMRGTN